MYSTDKLYHSDYKLIPTDLGLSNDIYLLYYKDKKYCVRLANNIHNEALRENERKIQEALKGKGIDVEEVYYNEKSKIRVTKWVDSLPFEECKDENKFERAIDLIKKFHQYAPKIDTDFDLINKFRYYSSFCGEYLKNIPYENILNDFSKLEVNTISHNDIVSGNLLLGEKDYLIDYEYAGNNVEHFDLMSFLSENKIYDENLRKRIYKYYFNKDVDVKTLQELLVIERAQELLWSTWALTNYQKEKRNDYLLIARDKLQHLKELLYETHIHC